MLAQTSTTVPIEIIVNPVVEVFERGTDWTQITLSVLLGVATLLVALLAIQSARSTAKKQRKLDAELLKLNEEQHKLQSKMAWLEATEHAWERQRRRAWIEVSRRNSPGRAGQGDSGYEYEQRWVRLTNVGKEAAYNVSWLVESQDTAMPVISAYVPEAIDEILPGEYVDLAMNISRLGDKDFYPKMTVRWRTSQNNEASNTRTINR